MLIAHYVVHYGSDYLGWSIKSVYDHVDKIYIIYTDTPSFGHISNAVNPDTKEKVKESAYLFGDPQNKINWIEGRWGNEGHHRSKINQIAAEVKADGILVTDADEIWPEDVIVKAIEDGYASGAGRGLIKMLTFWRSFNYTCADEMWPVRMFFPNRPQEPIHYLAGRVHHFGYARTPADIEYKLSIHGHRTEWRSGWYENTFLNWTPEGNMIDLHPTCLNTWNATPYDKTQLPAYMHDHPFYNLEVIK